MEGFLFMSSYVQCIFEFGLQIVAQNLWLNIVARNHYNWSLDYVLLGLRDLPGFIIAMGSPLCDPSKSFVLAPKVTAFLTRVSSFSEVALTVLTSSTSLWTAFPTFLCFLPFSFSRLATLFLLWSSSMWCMRCANPLKLYSRLGLSTFGSNIQPRLWQFISG